MARATARRFDRNLAIQPFEFLPWHTEEFKPVLRFTEFRPDRLHFGFTPLHSRRLTALCSCKSLARS
jgi:hypothetical protein